MPANFGLRHCVQPVGLPRHLAQPRTNFAFASVLCLPAALAVGFASDLRLPDVVAVGFVGTLASLLAVALALALALVADRLLFFFGNRVLGMSVLPDLEPLFSAICSCMLRIISSMPSVLGVPPHGELAGTRLCGDTESAAVVGLFGVSAADD